MRKLSVFLPLILVLVALVAVCATPAMAAGPSSTTTVNTTAAPIGKLNLYQKDPITWQLVPGGGSGTMWFNFAGSKFNVAFIGTKLQPNTKYSLIYYVDAITGPNSPELPGILIASGKSGPLGNILLGASISLKQNLPFATDANSKPDSSGKIYGAKIWLIPSSDYNASSNLITGWHLTQYLFQLNGIFYTYTPFVPPIVTPTTP